MVVQEYVSPEAPVAAYNGYVRQDGLVAGDFTSLLPSLGSTFPVYHGRLKEIGPVNTRKPRGESDRKVDPHHEE